VLYIEPKGCGSSKIFWGKIDLGKFWFDLSNKILAKLTGN